MFQVVHFGKLGNNPMLEAMVEGCDQRCYQNEDDDFIKRRMPRFLSYKWMQ
jgi:hypothetical protein